MQIVIGHLPEEYRLPINHIHVSKQARIVGVTAVSGLQADQFIIVNEDANNQQLARWQYRPDDQV